MFRRPPPSLPWAGRASHCWPLIPPSPARPQQLFCLCKVQAISAFALNLLPPEPTARTLCPQRLLLPASPARNVSCLAELLLVQGLRIAGPFRRGSTFNIGRLDPIHGDPHSGKSRVFLHCGDLIDWSPPPVTVPDGQPGNNPRSRPGSWRSSRRWWFQPLV